MHTQMQIDQTMFNVFSKKNSFLRQLNEFEKVKFSQLEEKIKVMDKTVFEWRSYQIPNFALRELELLKNKSSRLLKIPGSDGSSTQNLKSNKLKKLQLRHLASESS